MTQLRSAASEQWRDIPGWEGRYRVSSLGRVLRLERLSRNSLTGGVSRYASKIVSGTINQDGYHRVTLHRDGLGQHKQVHTLVLEAFVGPRQPGLECRHLDGNPSNNRLDNLAWGTSQQNHLDRTRHGNGNEGEKHALAKLTADQVVEIREKYATGSVTSFDLADKYGVRRSTISNVTGGFTWRSVGGPITHQWTRRTP